MTNPRKKPKFLRQNWQALQTLRHVKWRMPRGMHSKLRKKERGKGFLPRPGYGAPTALRGLHPSGYKEVLVSNVKDLLKIDQKKEAVKIRGTVGKKKRAEILKKAEELKIKMLNK
jgi:large subunit ribosomal protein L32e